MPDDVVALLNQARSRRSLAQPVFISLLTVAGLLFLLLAGRSLLLAAWLALVFAVPAFIARSRLQSIDARRQRVRLTYPAQVASSGVAAELDAAFSTLATASQVAIETEPDDLSADVNQLGAHQPPTRSLPAHLDTNAPAWRLNGAHRDLHFLPDRVLITSGLAYTESLTYRDFDVRLDTRTYEGSDPPPGARIYDQRWRYARRDGQPDRRYKDNPLIVKAYLGQITLLRDGEAVEGWLVPAAQIGDAFVAGIRDAQRLAFRRDAPLGIVENLPTAAPPVRRKVVASVGSGAVLITALLAALTLQAPVPAPAAAPREPARAGTAPTVTRGPATEEADTWTRTPAVIAPPTAEPTDAITAVPTPQPSPLPTDAPEPTPIPPTAAPTPTPPPATIGGVNLRAGPGTNYPIVGGLKQGASLPIVARSPNGQWYQLASGAWIFANLVTYAPEVAVAAVIPTPPPPTPRPTIAPSPTLWFAVQPPPPPAGRSCCKVCSKGKACGDTCIARNKTCHVGPGCACDG